LGVNFFDIIQNMVIVDREKRFDLEEAIRYAEEMYDQQENSPFKASIGQEIHNSDVKKELKRTQHSSSGKKCSPNLQRFYDFRDNLAVSRGELSHHPQTSNFTIAETSEVEEQSSML
jgi:hypothetical protein